MRFIKSFEVVGIADRALVGGKNASLGEMIQGLAAKGIKVPSGFLITVEGYHHHLEANNLIAKITELVHGLDKYHWQDFTRRGKAIRELIEQSPLPHDLVQEITLAYERLEKDYGKNWAAAVRSSATTEDLPSASFAGQQETFLNVQGIDAILRFCKKSFASLFTDRALSYRIDQGFMESDVALSVGIQKMVRSDKGSSGVMFTLDTESGLEDVVFITSAYGLGESVVQGMVNPDEFYVHKPTLMQGKKALLKKRCGLKQNKMLCDGQGVRTVGVPFEEQKAFSLNDEEILQLAEQGLVIEEYYATHHGTRHLDIEWVKDGEDGTIYIVQARPETVHSKKERKAALHTYLLEPQEKEGTRVIVQGKSIGSKIVQGKVRLIASTTQMHEVLPGEIVVTDMTDPDWEPIMKRAAGILTNRGGRTCHAAIVCRELGIPAVVGAQGATKLLKDGDEVTLDCSGGEIGLVYGGRVAYQERKITLNEIPTLPVALMMNVAHPDEAFRHAMLPNSGVGLARLEFIISSSIQVHPMALVAFDKVSDEGVRRRIETITAGYQDKKQFFIETLAREVGTIVAAFYPKEVIVRLSDFKSNEYRALLGGQFFEPEEENPMLGFRGASRYYHDDYKSAFELECKAMHKIREEMGLTNIKLMIPFVRTVAEAEHVVACMKEYGLVLGKEGFELYMMVEIPSNVILIDQFSKIFDGFSIGSNDLTQLLLGLDRDSALVANVGDERNEAVKKMILQAILGAHKAGKKIGICGEAPSNFPEFAQFLIECGIDSISLNPDAVIPTMLQLGKKLEKTFS